MVGTRGRSRNGGRRSAGRRSPPLSARLGAAAPVLLGLLLVGAGPVPSPRPTAAPSGSPLSISALAEPGSGLAPLDVYFQANVSGGSGTVTSIHWTFGDGGTGSGLSVRHLYTASGTFVVLVVAHDSANDVANRTLTVRVTAAPDQGSGDAPGGRFGAGWTSSVLWFVAGLAAGGAAIGFGGVLLRRRRLRAEPGSVPVPPGAREAEPTALARADDSPPLAVPEAGSDAAPTAARDRRRTSELVLLHLARWGPLRPDQIAEPERSQAGIGESLGLPQNVVSPVLRRLVAAGILEVGLRHVAGRPRRLKVYALSPQGESLARDLRTRRQPVRPPAPARPRDE